MPIRVIQTHIPESVAKDGKYYIEVTAIVNQRDAVTRVFAVNESDLPVFNATSAFEARLLDETAVPSIENWRATIEPKEVDAVKADENVDLDIDVSVSETKPKPRTKQGVSSIRSN